MFNWRFLTISSRILAITLFTSKYGYWTVPIAIGHWGFMTIWLLHQSTRICDSPITGNPQPLREYLFNFLIGAVYCVCFVPMKTNESTRIKYSVYYVITFIENSSMATFWYLNTTQHHTTVNTIIVSSTGHAISFQLVAFLWVHIAFLSGLFFMLLYYRFFHPNVGCQRVKQPARCC